MSMGDKWLRDVAERSVSQLAVGHHQAGDGNRVDSTSSSACFFLTFRSVSGNTCASRHLDSMRWPPQASLSLLPFTRYLLWHLYIAPFLLTLLTSFCDAGLVATSSSWRPWLFPMARQIMKLSVKTQKTYQKQLQKAFQKLNLKMPWRLFPPKLRLI